MTLPVDLGRDTSCTTSLRTGRFVSGPLLVAEAIYRRLTTPRGMLRGGEDEASYGLDLSALIGKTNPEGMLASLPGRLRSEITKDLRVLALGINVESTTIRGRVSFEITINAVTAEGPFALVILASSVTTELLGIT